MTDEQDLAELRERLDALEERFGALVAAVGAAGLREIDLLEHLGLPTRRVRKDAEDIMEARHREHPPRVVASQNHQEN